MQQNVTPKKRPTRKNMSEAIKKTAGNVSEIAQIFGWPKDRTKVYRYIDKYEMRKELEESREILVDLAESKLKSAVNNGDPQSVTFVLRTLGKKRGYGDSLVLTDERDKSQEEEVAERLAKLNEANSPRAN